MARHCMTAARTMTDWIGVDMPKGTRGICSVDDCERPHKSRGFCAPHLRRWRDFLDPLGTPETCQVPIDERCGHPSCPRRGWSLTGHCSSHAERYKTAGKTRVVQCATCQVFIEVPKRGRVAERYCSEGCKRVPCVIPECSAMADASRGMCWPHYRRDLEHDDPYWTLPRAERKKPVKQPCIVEGCEAKGTTDGLGMCPPHRTEERRRTRPKKICTIPDCDEEVRCVGLCERHYNAKCRHGDPLIDKSFSNRTHCANGHEYTEENTRWYTDPKSGYTTRACRMCHRSKQAERRAVFDADDADSIDWFALMERDGWRCRLCGSAIPNDAEWPNPLFGTIDHILPVARDGRHVWTNVQAAHLYCNMSKNDNDAPKSLPPGIDVSQLVLAL